jgi:hypothetical protein
LKGNQIEKELYFYKLFKIKQIVIKKKRLNLKRKQIERVALKFLCGNAKIKAKKEKRSSVSNQRPFRTYIVSSWRGCQDDSNVDVEGGVERLKGPTHAARVPQVILTLKKKPW